MLPLRDLLRELELEVVAGEAGLDRAVRWVHISELADPTPWLSGGELLLTTGLRSATRRSSASTSGGSSEHGLTGLGFGVGLLARARAGARCAPPRPSTGSRCSRSRTSCRSSRSPRRRSRSSSTSSTRCCGARWPRTSGSSGSCSPSAGWTAWRASWPALIGGPALIFDGRGELLARRGTLADGAAAALSSELRERASAGGRRGFVPGAEGIGPGALALPVARGAPSPTARGEAPLPEAWLIAAKDGGPLNELDRLTLHQAVTIVALELLRRRVVDDTERRLAGDVMSALVAGDLSGPELARRLEPFGLRERAGVLVLAPSRVARGPAEEALTRAVREEAGGGLVAPAGRFLCALLPATGDDELFALAARLHARVARSAGEPLPAGAGRTVAPGDLRRGFHEARCALEARALAVNGIANGHAASSPPTATSAPSSCCSRCRTTTRCGCSATRSWLRSRSPRARTAAS